MLQKRLIKFMTPMWAIAFLIQKLQLSRLLFYLLFFCAQFLLD